MSGTEALSQVVEHGSGKTQPCPWSIYSSDEREGIEQFLRVGFGVRKPRGVLPERGTAPACPPSAWTTPICQPPTAAQMAE